MIRVEEDDFDVGAEIAALTGGKHGIGAVVTFVGLVRDMAGGARIGAITLDHYPGMTERGLAEIEAEAGRQFFPDRLAALREMFRVLVSGGRLMLCVSRSIEHHQDAVAMAEALHRNIGAEAAAFRDIIFSLGEAEAIEVLLRDAGFRDIVIRPMVKTLRFPSAEAFTVRYISAVEPLARMVSEVDDNARTALLEDMSAALRPYVDPDGLAIPTASHVVTANK